MLTGRLRRAQTNTRERARRRASKFQVAAGQLCLDPPRGRDAGAKECGRGFCEVAELPERLLQ